MYRTPGLGGGVLNRELPSLPCRDCPLPSAWQIGEISPLVRPSYPFGDFFFLPVEGENADSVPPLHVGVSRASWEAKSLAGIAASVTNSISNRVLVQRLHLMFVNFSIFVFRERRD